MLGDGLNWSFGGVLVFWVLILSVGVGGDIWGIGGGWLLDDSVDLGHRVLNTVW